MGGVMTRGAGGVRPVAPVGLALAAILLAACAPDHQPVQTQVPVASPSTSAPTDWPQALQMTFDDMSARPADGVSVANAAGPAGGTIRVEGGSDVLELVSGVGGDSDVALQFPAPCLDAGCPAAVVEVPDSAAFSPGVRDFSFGATLRMVTVGAANGSNIVQKGFSTGGRGQWKLQVDGERGHPSCVLVGVGQERGLYRTTADVSVADGAWHDVECRRTGTLLTVRVDGREHGDTELPEVFVVQPPGPVRVGGKNLKAGNDQFFGAVDDVFLRVSAS